MFAQNPVPIPSDNTWSALLAFTDSDGNALATTGIQARIFIDRETGACDIDDYGLRIPAPSIVASTATGEINNSATGSLAVSVKLLRGSYRLRGETFIGTSLIAPFFIGKLDVGRSIAQLFIPALRGMSVLWNDGGVIAINTDARLIISQNGLADLPTTPGIGEFWNDGGVIAINGTPAEFPITLPAQPGILWNNNGVLSTS